MDEKYYVKSLKRLYDEADKIQRRESFQGTNALIETHNELVPELKSEFSANQVIQSIETIDFRETYKGIAPENIREIQTVKMNALRMADALGVEVDNFEKQASAEGMTVVNVNQSVQQSVDVSVNSVMQLVNNLPRKDTEKEELREIVNQYKEELDSSEPDSSTLRKLIDDAREYSKDVAVRLTMLGLKNGFYLLC
jgi:hypothetical protein